MNLVCPALCAQLTVQQSLVFMYSDYTDSLSCHKKDAVFDLVLGQWWDMLLMMYLHAACMETHSVMWIHDY